jgi:amidase
MSTSELCFLPAVELAHRLRTRELSAVEVMQAHLTQIDRVNPQVNAIVTLLPERALAGAEAADAALLRGDDVGPLHGLPIAHKDLVPTAGIRTTSGSPIYADHVPDQDALIVERLRAAGAITIGKTNVPEFGAGSQTFNPVFGATRNPYDLSKTCGGSSGGAAVALACGMLPIADGSDMGGSLRNPAGYCNVVGLRPSPGRVPSWPSEALWSPLSVEGPMARTVADVALMLSAIAGPDSRAPLSIAEPGARFAAPLERDFVGIRVAWSRDLGGLPVDARVTSTIDAQRHTFEALGCVVEDAEPDWSGADEVFKTFRALSFERGLGPLLDTHRELLKDTVVWNIEAGRRLTGPQIAAAERARAGLYQRLHTFLQRYQFLVLPVSQVPPFDLDQPYITEIDGAKLETYIDWMRSCYYVSATGLPAISVPCGFTADGLPVGVQIVGRHQDEWGVLQLAHAFEMTTSFWKRHPAVAEA